MWAKNLTSTAALVIMLKIYQYQIEINRGMEEKNDH